MHQPTPAELTALRAGGEILAHALQEVVAKVRTGIATAELNFLAERHLRAAGAEPAFFQYRGFPASLCTSVNAKVVHGIPSSEEILEEGDLISLDLGARYQGLYTDMAVTVPVGRIDAKSQRLVQVTHDALQNAIRMVKPGMTTGDVGSSIQTFIESQGFSVIRDLVGHGVGRQPHEDPMLPNFGIAGQGPRLTEGLVVAIEPMVSVGDWHVKTLDDGWSVVTLDGSLSAHFEHTIMITSQGAEILTQVHGHHPWP